MKALRISILLLCCMAGFHSYSQDSLITRPTADTPGTSIKIDSNRVRKHDPKIATRRSLILPGWGQAYNREYWKIPIVWGALGTCVGFWVYNNTWYQRTADAYIIMVNNDTASFPKIHEKLRGLDALSLQNYRNIFRRDRDYSMLYFLGAWALNVVDATVFAHLKGFDVSDDLSMKLRPNLNPVTRSAGLTLALHIK